jgi:hypothetical protein
MDANKPTRKELRKQIQDAAKDSDEIVRQYPEPPPGVQMFDPRRISRHQRKLHLQSVNRDLSQRLALSTQSKAALAGVIADRDAKIKAFEASLLGRVYRLIGRLFRRRR